MSLRMLCVAAVLCAFAAPSGRAQELPVSPPKTAAGIWLGTLEVPPAKLRLGFVIESAEGGGWKAVLHSIDQGGVKLGADEVTVTDGEVVISIKAIGGGFKGKLSADGDTIDGAWSQGGNSLTLKLARVETLPNVVRPQEPKPPFPYRAEEVEIPQTVENFTLAGTLTLPEGNGPFPAVVLITGSGIQDRDEAVMGHRPFLVLADALTRRGIAVLRHDDRGAGKSGGDPSKATTREFAQDTWAAVEFLAKRPEIDAKRIGLIGHSEGGISAPMLAVEHPDAIAFLVLIAPPGVTGEAIIMDQTAVGLAQLGLNVEDREKVLAVYKEVFDIVERDVSSAARDQVTQLAEKLPDAMFKNEDKATARSMWVKQMGASTTPWFRYFISYDPAPTLAKVKCPVLAVIGEKDTQVSPSLNRQPLADALRAAGQPESSLQILPGLNHLLQTANTGLVEEYASIEETMSPAALQLIGEWVVEQSRQPPAAGR